MRRACVLTIVIAGVVGWIHPPQAASSSEEKAVSYQLKAVTVFPSSAALRFEANVQFQPGKQGIVFEDIVVPFDEESMQVAVEADQRLKILGARLRTRYTTQDTNERRQQLLQQIKQIQEKIAQLNAQEKVTEQQAKFLESLRFYAQDQWPKDLATRMPSVDEVQSWVGYLAQAWSQIEEDRLARLRQREQWNDEIRRLKQELDQLGSHASRQIRDVVIDCEASQSARGKVILTVMSQQTARWHPFYTVQYDSSQPNELTWSAYALVQQKTGLDFKGVDLTVSTAQPMRASQPPRVEPWWLRPYQPQALAERQGRAAGFAGIAPELKQEEVVMGLASDTVSQRDEIAAEEAWATVEEAGIAQNFRIPQKVDIPSDWRLTRWPMMQQRWPLVIRHRAYPFLMNDVFVLAETHNDSDVHWLPGEMQIIRDGVVVGRSRIEALPPQKKISLSLGFDPAVSVKKILVQKNLDDIFFGQIKSRTRTTSYDYRIHVENHHDNPIVIDVLERMPVSTDESIAVEMKDVSIEPLDKEFEDVTGLWRWALTLAAQSQQDISYRLIIKAPRDMPLRLP